MSGVEVVLAVAALLIGATGSWSPCGFSMVETIGPAGHTGGRRTTLAACASFLPGALLGGVATFAALAQVGAVLQLGGGRFAYVAAAAIAACAALAEARGTRIAPQIRRQLPEHWRRLMPMPLAGFLYGILLGLGFTTFVLSFGVWALAGISLALGSPGLGLLIGVAFGLGRALPVVSLAPSADGRLGSRVLDRMAQRPLLYRGFRIGDALALAICAAALLSTQPEPAGAAGVTPAGGDPSAFGGDLVFERPNGDAVLRRRGEDRPLPGSDPAAGGPYIAVRTGDAVTLLDRGDLQPLARVRARGVDAIAVSAAWLAYRAHSSRGNDLIKLRRLRGPGRIGRPRTIARAKGPAQLSRPSVDRSRLVYGRASRSRSRIQLRRLGRRPRQRTLLSSRRMLLFNPSINGRRIAYVRTKRGGSQLFVKRVKRRGKGRKLLGIGKRRGTLWTTALTDRRAYVTVLEFGQRGNGHPRIVFRRR